MSEKQKPRITLDDSHGEHLYLYRKLIETIEERCIVTVLKKKPLDLTLLINNDIYMIIDPDKSWKEGEIEIIRGYLENRGGILITIANYGYSHRKSLPQLSAPFGIVFPSHFSYDIVDDKYFLREDLGESPLLDGVKSLTATKTWSGTSSTGMAVPDRAEVLLKYKDKILGVKLSLGKGAVYFFSCMPVFENSQMEEVGNRRFVENLLTSLGAPSLAELQEAVIKGENVPEKDTSTPQAYEIYFKNPLPEVTGGSKGEQKWDQAYSGKISWSEDGLDIEGSPRLSAPERALGGHILTSSFFQSLHKEREEHIATSEIVKVVIAPSSQSSNVGIVHILTEKSDGTRDIYCLEFRKPTKPEASRPPLWLFQGWLTKSLPADKLEIRS